MDNAEEIPSYALNDVQSFLRFLRDAYRKRQDVVIRADDCRYLADTLQESTRSDYGSGASLFD